VRRDGLCYNKTSRSASEIPVKEINMEIGTVIRNRRRAKDMTQEELAEVLNLSVSAVSQWECGKNLPDLTIIPALCRVLEITSDELLGMDQSRQEEEISEIVEEASSWGSRGYLEKEQEILKDGLKRYPDSWLMMHQLMHCCYLRWTENHDNTESLDQAIRYGEKILEKCTEDDTRQGAVQILCYAYDQKGDKERAEKLAWSACSLYCCRDSLLADILEGEHGLEHNRNFVKSLLDLLILDGAVNYTLESGKKRFSDEEQVQVYQKMIDVFRIMFEEGDYGFYHLRLWDVHTYMARYYAGRKDIENTVTQLKTVAYHAVKFVEFSENPDFTQTSLLFRGQNGYGFSVNKTDNTAADSLKELNHARYDFLRDTPEFEEIRTALESRAGEWHKRT